jgi:hypothetical protein
MSQTSESGLKIVFRNPQPKRELQQTTTWLLYARDFDLRIVVSHDRGNRPRILSKEAA